MKQKFYKIVTKILLQLSNRIYSYVGRTAILAEGGVHPKHRITGYHNFFLSNILATDNVLDIGCGPGELAFDVAKKAKKVVGIDFSEKYIARAKKNYILPNLEYIFGDATKKTLNEKFDVVILSNVLEHIENRVPFLQAIKTLAPKFLIRVPMIDRDWLTLYKKELGIEWRADLTHFLEYTVPILKQETESAGMKIDSYSVQFGELWAVVSIK
jgi:2-polyprenyl-3-methyl-5-hydroxy-6-metoxy-1,4-benzoquinol methylase